jgi:hypothetical protein
MPKETTKNYFTELNSVDVSKMIEKKNGLSYLTWSFAWMEVKKRHPDAFYTIYEREDGCPYFTDGKTCWVKTGVTVEGIEHIEYLPVMDYRNQSIPLERITSMDMNKTIQRSLTKACARHGLGLYVYAGEDLPMDAADAEKQQTEQPKKKTAAKPATQPAPATNPNDGLFGKPTEQELREAFEIIRPNIESAPSKQYLKELHAQNVALHDYSLYKDAMNKRYKEVS